MHYSLNESFSMEYFNFYNRTPKEQELKNGHHDLVLNGINKDFEPLFRNGIKRDTDKNTNQSHQTYTAVNYSNRSKV
jgi:hypothetical protein